MPPPLIRIPLFASAQEVPGAIWGVAALGDPIILISLKSICQLLKNHVLGTDQDGRIEGLLEYATSQEWFLHAMSPSPSGVTAPRFIFLRNTDEAFSAIFDTARSLLWFIDANDSLTLLEHLVPTPPVSLPSKEDKEKAEFFYHDFLAKEWTG